MNVAFKPPGYTFFDAHPLSPGCGAELLGIDLSGGLPDAAIEEIRAALLQYKVVFFRDQKISRAQHLTFARRFGALEIHPSTPADQTDPEVLRIVRGAEKNGRENLWHADVTWREAPSLGSILRAIEIPPLGGDTLFANMVMAYEGLSPQLRRWIDGLTAVHDIAKVHGKRLGRGIEELREKYPLMQHPVVRKHPETGQKLIFVNTAFTTHVVGLSPKESDWLLAHLYAQAALPEYQCRFRWQPNSMAFWDNRACQHYAASDYFPQVRIMERVTIAGDKPY